MVAGLAATPTLLLLAASPAAAAGDGSVQVSNTETIQAYLDATGKVDIARVDEQVAMKGSGTVDLCNPVETHGLRNLDGFGAFEVKDGVMVGTYAVDGEKRLRTVSDFTKNLPLKVEVTYTLDGTPWSPVTSWAAAVTRGALHRQERDRDPAGHHLRRRHRPQCLRHPGASSSRWWALSRRRCPTPSRT